MYCFATQSIFGDGSMNVITGRTKVGLRRSQITENTDPYFEYVSESESEGSLTPLLIHLLSSELPDSSAYVLAIRELGTGTLHDRELARTVLFNRTRVKGCAFTIPGSGNYEIGFDSVPPGSSGRLTVAGDLAFSRGSDVDNVFWNAAAFSISKRTPVFADRCF
jgi:hypothetical protein